MGYEIDNGPTVTKSGSSWTAKISANLGTHMLKVKCWGSSGATQQTDLSITIIAAPPAPATAANIPSNAVKVPEIQTLPGWRTKYDPATSGTASGLMSMVTTPTLSGQTARYDTTSTGYGGVLYSVTYGTDTLPHNFVYDAEVYIASGSVLGNLEMDNNQVTANGDTIIYAFQCAGTSGFWEYSENSGTPAAPNVRWVKSTQPCNPMNWSTDTWHHIQISTSRDDSGNVTYHSVFFDGVEYPINKTVMSDFQLRWKIGVLVANFQVDGTGASAPATSTLFLDNFTLYRW